MRKLIAIIAIMLIGTVSWSGASDTIIIMTESTTAKQYQYYQVDIKGADNTLLASIKELFSKFWE